MLPQLGSLPLLKSPDLEGHRAPSTLSAATTKPYLPLSPSCVHVSEREIEKGAKGEAERDKRRREVGHWSKKKDSPREIYLF